MMKKTYISPQQGVIQIKPQQMLCGSITEVGDDLNVIISSEEPGGVFEDGVINAREFEEW